MGSKLWLVVGLLVGGAVAFWLTLEEDAPAPPSAPVEVAVEAVPDAGGEPPAPGPVARVERPSPVDPFCGTSEPLSLKWGSLTTTRDGSTTSKWWMELRTLDGGQVLDRAELTDRPPELGELLLEARKEADPDRKLELVRKARAVSPNDPEVAMALLPLLRPEVDLEEELGALGAVLSRISIPAYERKKARLEVARDIQRGFQQSARGGLHLLWPPDVVSREKAARILDQLELALDEAARLTGKPARRHLSAVVYRDRSELLAVTCAPTWSGGAFDGTLRLVADPSALGVDLTALRHEATHAQVHAYFDSVPLWFDEGLANRLGREGQRRKRAWELMVRNRSWIPFSSLEESLREFDKADASLAYAQASAMVQLVFDCGGEAAIAQALAGFDQGVRTDAMFQRACGREVTGEDLLKTVSALLQDAAPR